MTYTCYIFNELIKIIYLLTEPKQPAYVRENRILGQLKLTIHYQRGAFMVIHTIYNIPLMVSHYDLHTAISLNIIEITKLCFFFKTHNLQDEGLHVIYMLNN